MPVIRTIRNDRYSRNRNNLRNSSKSTGGHNFWLLFGLILAILAVLFLIFYPTIKENLFGKAEFFLQPKTTFIEDCDNGFDDDGDRAIDCDDSQCSTTTACLKTVASSGEGSIGTEGGTESVNTGSDVYVCMNIHLIPSTGIEGATARQDICVSSACTFTMGISGGAYNPAGDICTGEATFCPVIDTVEEALVCDTVIGCFAQPGFGGSRCVQECIDADRDGYCFGNQDATHQEVLPALRGAIIDWGDLADNDLTIYPGAPENSNTLCADGKDNDQDTLTDCADSNCASVTACIPPPPECTADPYAFNCVTTKILKYFLTVSSGTSGTLDYGGDQYVISLSATNRVEIRKNSQLIKSGSLTAGNILLVNANSDTIPDLYFKINSVSSYFGWSFSSTVYGTKELACNDIFDNNADDLTDCDDSDCSTLSACTEPSDSDSDGILDSDEVAACINHGVTGRVSPNGCYYGDSNSNGCLSSIEYNDFKIGFVAGIYSEIDPIKYNDHKIDYLNNANNIRCLS